MAKRTRIYTRAGDAGQTGLVGGQRVAKTHARIETYGTVDELSSAIGVARAQLIDMVRHDDGARRLDEWLAWTQNVLFDLGAELATPAGKGRAGMPVASDDQTRALERAIDEAENDLEPLDTFILPGGTGPGAALHFARTVCRRAERLLVQLRREEPEISEATMALLNRLSDALFVWARWINHQAGAPEQRWSVKAAPPSAEGEPLERS